MLKCVGTLITWPYTAGGRSRLGSSKAGTTVYELFTYKFLSLVFRFILLIGYIEFVPNFGTKLWFGKFEEK